MDYLNSLVGQDFEMVSKFQLFLRGIYNEIEDV